MGSKRIDYTIKEEFDLSLISSEYLHILQEKNKGKSFEDIAKVFGQSASATGLTITDIHITIR